MKPAHPVCESMYSGVWHNPCFPPLLRDLGVIDVPVECRVTVVVDEEGTVFVEQMVQEHCSRATSLGV